MFTTSSNSVAYLALGNTDMRKSINTLSILVQEHMKQNPFNGHLYVFCNRGRSIIKILYWDRNGFCLWQKRLEKDKFKWPASEKEVKEIDLYKLQWLLEGLDVNILKGYERLNYATV